jgi:hypothetical protein
MTSFTLLGKSVAHHHRFVETANPNTRRSVLNRCLGWLADPLSLQGD